MHLKFIIPLILLLVIIAKLFFNSHDVIDPDAPDYLEQVLERERALVQGRCSRPEDINRHHLQQTWFDSPNYESVAMAFGQSGFAAYKPDSVAVVDFEGAFCIDGSILMVRYLETEFVFSGLGFGQSGIFGINYSRKMVPLSEGEITVVSLDPKEMTLRFEEQGLEKVLYRKN